jgi:TolA-binding protein
VTGQLLQLRKDIERRQQLITVLNQQVNIVSTHLHNLELVHQGHSAKLPNSEEVASDAAKAEEMLAGLEADAELAGSIGAVSNTGMSAEEQALYDELERENAPEVAERESPSVSTPIHEEPTKVTSNAAPRRAEPEAG